MFSYFKFKGPNLFVTNLIVAFSRLGNKGPHLIVVPSSIFDNWRKELELWCPSLKVLPYTGNQDERAQIRDEIMDENALENYNILISTYSQVGGGVGFAGTQPV